MTIELPGAAAGATVAGEPDIADDLDELLLRELEKPFAFCFKGNYLFVERERNQQPPSSCPALASGLLS
ncbi:hypothetical protein [Methanoculleus sp.]|uniref:hypothetical protein n=1 Tax=Methanoculleus sp. TaxID=90427 RepID=UPI0034528967